MKITIWFSRRTKSDRNDFLFRSNVFQLVKRTQSAGVPPNKTNDEQCPLPLDHIPVTSVLKGWFRLIKFVACHISICLWLLVRTRKAKVPEYSENYTENKLITAVRAMHEFLLKPSFVWFDLIIDCLHHTDCCRDLESLQQYKTRSPYSDVVDSSQMLTVYRRGDVEKRYFLESKSSNVKTLIFRAYEVWGNPEMLNKEKIKRSKNRHQDYEGKYSIEIRRISNDVSVRWFSAIFSLKKSVKEYERRLSMLENAAFENRRSVTFGWNKTIWQNIITFYFRSKEIFSLLVVAK